MTKSRIEISDELLDEVRAVLGDDLTKTETVRTALELVVRQHRQRRALDWFVENDPLRDLRDSEVKAAARR